MLARSPGAVRPSWLEGSYRTALLITAVLFSAGYSVIGLVLLLLSVVAEAIVIRRAPWRPSSADIFLVSFIAVFMVSGWVSQYRPLALGSAGLAAFSIYLSFGPLYQTVRRDQGFLKPFLGAWVVGGILSAAWAYYLHRVTGHPAFTPELAQNALASTTLIALVLGLGVFLTARNVGRYFVAVGCVVLALALTVTISRGAWIGVAVALLTFFALVKFRSAWQGLVLVVLAGVMVAIVTAPERAGLLLRASSIPQVGTHDRVLLARSAEAIFADHPVIGTGLNTFALVYPKYRFPGDTNVAPPYAHNIFLNMAAEGGALGFAAFSAIVLWTVVAAWQWRAASMAPTDRILSATILATFVGLVVHQLFDGTILTVHLGVGLWFLVAIATAFRPDRTHRGSLTEVRRRRVAE